MERVTRQLSGPALEGISSFYSLGPLSEISQEMRGLINSTFYLTARNNRYVATLFRSKSRIQVQEIAEIMHSLRELPIAKPLLGQSGYVHTIEAVPVILSPFIQGTHSVSEEHTIKTHLKASTHADVACLFWSLHRQLRGLRHLGGNLPIATISNTINQSDEYIEYLVKKLGLSMGNRMQITNLRQKCQEDIIDDIRISEELELVHSDFERQNVLLSVDGKINGIVDFDSLKRGELLYEFSHALYNFVCCDPSPEERSMDIYIDSYVKEGMLPLAGLKKIPSLMSRFCIEDIVGFLKIAEHRSINIEKLTQHYDNALTFARKYLRS